MHLYVPNTDYDTAELQQIAKELMYTVPGLELFGTQWVCDIFNGVTQTVGVVISGVDAPAENDKKQVSESET